MEDQLKHEALKTFFSEIYVPTEKWIEVWTRFKNSLSPKETSNLLAKTRVRQARPWKYDGENAPLKLILEETGSLENLRRGQSDFEFIKIFVDAVSYLQLADEDLHTSLLKELSDEGYEYVYFGFFNVRDPRVQIMLNSSEGWIIKASRNDQLYYDVKNDYYPIDAFLDKEKIPLNPGTFEGGTTLFSDEVYEGILKKLQGKEKLITPYRVREDIEVTPNKNNAFRGLVNIGISTTGWNKYDLIKAIGKSGLLVPLPRTKPIALNEDDPEWNPDERDHVQWKKNPRTGEIILEKLPDYAPTRYQLPASLIGGRPGKYIPGLRFTTTNYGGRGTIFLDDGVKLNPLCVFYPKMYYETIYRIIFGTQRKIDWNAICQYDLMSDSILVKHAQELGLSQEDIENRSREDLCSMLKQLSQERLKLTRERATEVVENVDQFMYRPGSRWAVPTMHWEGYVPPPPIEKTLKERWSQIASPPRERQISPNVSPQPMSRSNITPNYTIVKQPITFRLSKTPLHKYAEKRVQL